MRSTGRPDEPAVGQFERTLKRASGYSGTQLFVDGQVFLTLGEYLGGGNAGVVHEATMQGRLVAVKVVNPIVMKMAPRNFISQCLIVMKGQPGARAGTRLRRESVWWLWHRNTQQVIPTLMDSSGTSLRELTIAQCAALWGWNPPQAMDLPTSAGGGPLPQLRNLRAKVPVQGQTVAVPEVPPKFIAFLRKRRKVLREIAAMRQLGSHPNIVQLEDVVEHVEKNQSTMFLVLEMAAGGELFDRIKVDKGCPDQVARHYMRQLVAGVAFCHDAGICHRDLKPENLLLAEDDDTAHVLSPSRTPRADSFSQAEVGMSVGAILGVPSGSQPDEQQPASAPVLANGTLKIADFGLSAITDEAEIDQSDAGSMPGTEAGTGPSGVPPLSRLHSVVGSPHYVAPEVVRTQPASSGYDGRKADAWSCGVILYAMLAGSLPFRKDIHHCQTFQRFSDWVGGVEQQSRQQHTAALQPTLPSDSFPDWFLPRSFALDAKRLIAALLHPDPSRRITVAVAAQSPYLKVARKPESPSFDSSTSGSSREAESPRVVSTPPASAARRLGRDQSVTLSSHVVAACVTPVLGAASAASMQPYAPSVRRSTQLFTTVQPSVVLGHVVSSLSSPEGQELLATASGSPRRKPLPHDSLQFEVVADWSRHQVEAREMGSGRMLLAVRVYRLPQGDALGSAIAGAAAAAAAAAGGSAPRRGLAEAEEGGCTGPARPAGSDAASVVYVAELLRGHSIGVFAFQKAVSQLSAMLVPVIRSPPRGSGVVPDASSLGGPSPMPSLSLGQSASPPLGPRSHGDDP